MCGMPSQTVVYGASRRQREPVCRASCRTDFASTPIVDTRSQWVDRRDRAPMRRRGKRSRTTWNWAGAGVRPSLASSRQSPRR
jgi:hypothetical protein